MVEGSISQGAEASRPGLDPVVLIAVLHLAGHKTYEGSCAGRADVYQKINLLPCTSYLIRLCLPREKSPVHRNVFLCLCLSQVAYPTGRNDENKQIHDNRTARANGYAETPQKLRRNDKYKNRHKFKLHY